MAKRLSPFETSEEESIDYNKLIKEFGTQPISTVKNIPKGIKAFDDGYIFSHRDFDKFMKDVKSKKDVAILTGFNASGSIHLGHKLTFDVVVELQKKYNIPVYIPISDDESYIFEKIDNQEVGMKNARLIAAQMVALGFDMKRTKIFIHQEYTDIYNFVIKLSKKVTLSTIKAIYGFNDSTSAGKMFYPVIQAADILLPQLDKFGGKKSVLVPVGIDQDPHVRLSRDLAAKFGLNKPATIHMKYLSSLRGGPKMSKSLPGSAIFLNEDPKKAAKFCMQALTGGRDTVEEQKKKGGEADKCVVYHYLKVFFEDKKESTKRHKNCYGGKLLCGECKKCLAKDVEIYLKDFQSKVKKAEKNIDKYLIK
ncbi:MAG: tryptophan--tRNA ligase [Candidatus Aenigmarchaeota archaeon]|nr:tryptophan--tRNA ligase [Candidatus Aenigmarchaeota archaeon]